MIERHYTDAAVSLCLNRIQGPEYEFSIRNLIGVFLENLYFYNSPGFFPVVSFAYKNKGWYRESLNRIIRIIHRIFWLSENTFRPPAKMEWPTKRHENRRQTTSTQRLNTATFRNASSPKATARARILSRFSIKSHARK